MLLHPEYKEEQIYNRKIDDGCFLYYYFPVPKWEGEDIPYK
jgi:hypothetical protein